MNATRAQHARRLLAGAGLAAVATFTLAGCGHASSSAPDAARSALAAISSAQAGASGAATSGTGDGASSSSTAGSDGSAAGVDTCSLLSVDQASSLTGKTFASSKSETIETQRLCTYTPTEADDQELIVTVDGGEGCWDTVTGSGESQQSVPGVGDAAYGLASGLDVKHGSTCIEVTGDSHAESLGDWSADVAVAQAVIKGLG